MSEKIGTLQMQPSGRWAVCRPGRMPVEITSGEVFRVAVRGLPGLQLTRMEYDREATNGYYSVDGFWLYDGVAAATAD